VAAGEALAYLNEYWIERRVGFDYPEEEEEVVENIVQKLSELAKDGSKKIRCVPGRLSITFRSWACGWHV
jgi:hypothetical protein